jgi:hypothetical protein
MTSPSETLADELERQLGGKFPAHNGKDESWYSLTLTTAQWDAILAALRSQPQGQAGEPVTPEMVRAGVSVFCEYAGETLESNVVELIFTAMEKVRIEQSAAPPVAEGWIEVPREPTAEQHKAFCDAHWNGTWMDGINAMLAVAP